MDDDNFSDSDDGDIAGPSQRASEDVVMNEDESDGEVNEAMDDAASVGDENDGSGDESDRDNVAEDANDIDVNANVESDADEASSDEEMQSDSPDASRMSRSFQEESVEEEKNNHSNIRTPVRAIVGTDSHLCIITRTWLVHFL